MTRTEDTPYHAIAARLGGQLRGRWALKGGVSADVQALEVAYPDGSVGKVVLRHSAGTDTTPMGAEVTSMEHDLLAALSSAGLPVPAPRFFDASGEVLPGPFMVMDFVEGTTDIAPDALGDALMKMADFLARLHAIDVSGLSIPGLPEREPLVHGILTYLPQTEGFAPLRALLEHKGAALEPTASALLHGDFWANNILWREGQIAAVIDWEDAATGDPISDLAGSRVELLWCFGEDAMAAFTDHYRQCRGVGIDPVMLALWELYVGSAGLNYMGQWGLDPAIEARMRARTMPFLARASSAVMSPSAGLEIL